MNDVKPSTAPDVSLPAWRALLLHQLPEDEALQLERRLLADALALDALREAEHDLFDDYARERLDPAEREAFEHHLLITPDAQERLRISRALASAPPSLPVRRARFSERPRTRRRSIGIALAGSAIAAGLALAVVLLPAAHVTGRAGTTTAATPASAPQSVVLLASVARGTQSQAVEVALARDTRELRFQAEIEQADPGARYRLRVLARDGSGASLLQVDNLALASAGRYQYVEALLPATVLAAGDVVLRVEAQPPASPFTFDWTVRATPP